MVGPPKKGFGDRFFWFLFVSEVIVVVLYSVFAEYGAAADPRFATDNDINELYGFVSSNQRVCESKRDG